MNNPDPIDPLLQTWQPEPTAQNDFADKVHGRIAQEEVQNKRTGWRYSTALPLAASLAIVAGTVAGAFLGGDRASQETMADAYARSIDPVRMMDIESHP